MNISKKRRPHLIFEWKLAPEYLNAKYYQIFVHYPDRKQTFLIGQTRGLNSDRIYPIAHPGFDSRMSTEEYLITHVFFPHDIPDEIVERVENYLEAHKRK